MRQVHEIDYAGLIDRVIGDFRPVKRLWPVGARLSLWILLDALIVVIGAAISNVPSGARPVIGTIAAIAPVAIVGIAAAFLALRAAIPDRAVRLTEGLAVSIAIAGAMIFTVSTWPNPTVTSASLNAQVAAGILSAAGMIGLAATPCVALFWAVGRGMPVQARSTGGLIGIAGACFGIVAVRLISPPANLSSSMVLLCAALTVTVCTSLGGHLLLAHRQRLVAADPIATPRRLRWIDSWAIPPLVLAASTALAMIALKTGSPGLGGIPDFDLAIASYEQSVTNFKPNVPSGSIETLLTAYIEDGMPPYMWDFGPQGYRLVGGRFERLGDGTPLTYTLFRGEREAVMCMFKRTDAFRPPSGGHRERRDMFFYEYRNFSICLINVGGYGDFLSVIVSPMPMPQFRRLIHKSL